MAPVDSLNGIPKRFEAYARAVLRTTNIEHDKNRPSRRSVLIIAEPRDPEWHLLAKTRVQTNRRSPKNRGPLEKMMGSERSRLQRRFVWRKLLLPAAEQSARRRSSDSVVRPRNAPKSPTDFPGTSWVIYAATPASFGSLYDGHRESKPKQKANGGTTHGEQ